MRGIFFEELRKPTKSSIRIVSVITDMETSHLTNKNQRSYCLNELYRYCHLI
jgi:hypothetical protein